MEMESTTVAQTPAVAPPATVTQAGTALPVATTSASVVPAPVMPAPATADSAGPTSGDALLARMSGFNTLLWLAFLIVGFLLTIPVVLRYEKSSSLTVLDGKLSHDLEKFITREHPFRNPSLNSWAALELRAFNTGKSGVVIGEEGWLFTHEEFPLPSTQAKVIRRNLAKIRATVDLLRSKGIETVVVPVPAKAEIYSDHVPEKLRGHIVASDVVTDYLSQHRIPWIPLKDAMLQARSTGADPFFRTETHWTPEGSRLAAERIAAWVGEQGRNNWTPRPFTVTPLASKPLESDLETFIPVRPGFAHLLPPGEKYQTYRVESAETVASESALFSDAGNPVALVGTSYSADERWNFTGWLRSLLATDIDNVSEKAKGPYASMEKFLDMLDDGKTGARLVIWEIPVRSVAVDYSPRRNYGAQ